MKFVHTTAADGHDPQFFLVRGRIVGSAEAPRRAAILLAAALEQGLTGLEADPATATPARLATVHTPDYLRFLEDAGTQWRLLPDAGPEVVANVHPQRYPGSYPTALVGRAGWHMADAACPIGPATFAAAKASAAVALTAADLVLAGERPAVYALCRPPGHHAYPDMAGGFCFLNNSALAAEALLTGFRRVAVLDLDVHHGNGTQAVFYARPDVLTVSVHADPAHYYPFFWGYAHERGEAAGIGANCNLPLPVGGGDGPWLAAIAEGQAVIRAFAAEALVLALGLDAHQADPLQGLQVSFEAYRQAGRHARDLDLPTVIVQEGGYLSPALGAILRIFLDGFAGSG